MRNSLANGKQVAACTIYGGIFLIFNYHLSAEMTTADRTIWQKHNKRGKVGVKNKYNSEIKTIFNQGGLNGCLVIFCAKYLSMGTTFFKTHFAKCVYLLFRAHEAGKPKSMKTENSRGKRGRLAH